MNPLTMDDQSALQKNLAQLHLDAFHILLMTTGIIAWIWFSWAILPDTSGADFRSVAWIPSILLVGGVFVCWSVQKHSANAAIMLFMGGLVSAISLGMSLTMTPQAAYLFCIVIVFAGVLLNRKRLVVLVLGIILLMICLEVISPDFTLNDFVLPIIVLSLVTIATWVSTYSLQIAITWTLNGYQQARKNEIMVREQKAELLYTMQKLDAAVQQLQSTNQMLQEARTQADEARKLKQQFVQTISHELRTPLNLIVGFSETMVKSPEYYGEALPPAYLRDLSIVYRNATHLQNMVNDVLDLARLEKAAMELVLEPLDMSSIVHDAMETIGSLIEQRGLTLQSHLAPDLPLVLGDAVRLKQVLLNLLNNAARFTEHGQITVHATLDDEGLVVCVEDTGEGIPQAYLQEIFEPFRQVDASMQRRNNGSGLGLTISKHLMELQGGTIWAESTLGHGSRFYFRLPLLSSHDTALNQSFTPEIGLEESICQRFGVDAYLVKPVSRASLWHQLESLAPERSKILVIDDNQDFVRLMQRFLMSLPRPYQVVGAGNAAEAIALVGFHQPDILLLDLHLPDMQGIELVQAVRFHLRKPSHVIIVSAYEELSLF